MKKSVKILIITIFGLALCLFAGYYVYDNFINVYSFKEISNVDKTYNISFEEFKPATSYTIEILDSKDNVIMNFDTTKTENEVVLDKLSFNEEYSINVNAYKDKKMVKKIKRAYKFKWAEPTFDNDVDLVLDEKNPYLNIAGDITKKDYKIEFFDGDKLLLEEKINNAKYKINKDILNLKNTVFTVKIVDDGYTLAETELYYGVNPVDDVKFANLNNDEFLKYQDFDLIIDGGKNATSITLDVLDNNDVIKTFDVKDNKVKIEKADFVEGNKYTFKLVAVYKEYKKEVSVTTAMISPLRAEMVNLAASQLGNEGGKKFWTWYGTNSRFEWCACFISWLAYQNGIMNTKIPKFINTGDGAYWFKIRNQFKYRGTYTPKPGDIIFIDWNDNDRIDHVGLVEKVENGTLYTIEGNSRDAVRKKSYPLTSKYLYGYGIPKYEE